MAELPGGKKDVPAADVATDDAVDVTLTPLPPPLRCCMNTFVPAPLDGRPLLDAAASTPLD